MKFAELPENEMSLAPSREVIPASLDGVPTEETIVRQEEWITLGEAAQELLSETTRIKVDAEAQATQVEQGFQVEKTLADGVVGLGLSATESAEALDGIKFTARLENLRDRLSKNTGRLEEAMKRGVGVATGALVLSMATPAFAETQVGTFETLAEQENSTLAIEHTPLPSYAEAMQRLRASILTAPTEERAVFVRTKDGALMKTMLLKKGKLVSVGFTDDEVDQYVEAMRSRTAEIEDVHTHPIDAQKNVGLISEEKAAAMARGEIAPSSTEPSIQDWNMLFYDEDTYDFPPGQMSHRVVDPTGEWEYGVSDSGSPFIVGMRKARKEIEHMDIADMGLTAAERVLVQEELETAETTFHGMFEIMNGNNARFDVVREKITGKIASLMSKYVSVEDLSKYHELTQPLSSSMDSEGRGVRVLRMQEIATALGFRLSYMPNSDLTEKTH